MKKKYTLTKKGWIVLGTFSVILISIIVYSVFNREKEIVFETYQVEQTTSEKLSNALKNNEISIDEYVLYTAYSIYDSSKLDDKYKSEVDYNIPPNLYNLVENNKNEISEKTKEYINEKILLKDVILGPKTNETSYNNSNVIPMSNSIAIEGDVKHRLDKYVLSSGNKVVVWYTTNDTIDKITDEIAQTIANNIETYINKYSSEYGVEFKFEKAYFNGYNETTYKEFLNGIDANNAEKLFNAMPVYVSASNVNENVIAYYTPADPGELYEKESANTDNLQNHITGIPIGPYINITSTKVSDITSLNSVVAHELFHHFQQYICGEGTYIVCEDNENGEDLFIQETTANWAAAKITDNSYIMNNYIVSYTQNYNYSIDDINPYTSMYFLMNYENTVENGKQKIINGLLKKYHNGDTLKYLYEASEGKMPEVMRNLSKNTLLNNYQYEGFKGLKEANLNYLCVSDGNNCTRKEITNTSGNIKNMAMAYFGNSKNDKKFKISNLSNNDTSYINVFSFSDKKEFDGYNKKVESFANQKVVYSKKLTEDVIVDLSKIDGEYVLISITNGHLTDEMSYKIEETNEETNIELNYTEESSNNNDNSTTAERPSQVFNIYIDGTEYQIDNFEVNSRAFVDINEFCSLTSNICQISYIDETLNKIKVTKTLKTNNSIYEYTLINEKQKEVFDSTLTVAGVNFDLSQLSVDASSCPEGKDSNGYEIPKCDANSFYVPIRFVTQALGYDVNWSSEDSSRIDINSGLQEKLINNNNIRIVLSKNKVDIGNTVNNIIDIRDTMKLDKNTTYYAYAIDNNNNRVFNSGFALLSGSKNDFKITNDLDTNKNQKTTYSTLKTGSKNNKGIISIVTTITIPSENNDSKGGIYPIIKEFNVTIK